MNNFKNIPDGNKDRLTENFSEDLVEVGSFFPPANPKDNNTKIKVELKEVKDKGEDRPREIDDPYEDEYKVF